MAMDKIVDSAALESNLTAVADAIRAKTGGADRLAFPDGMVEAIEGISGGGGGGSTFETSADGKLPDCDHGLALSNLVMDFEAFATETTD